MRDQSEGGEYESDDGEHGHYRHGSMDCSSGEDGGSADEEPIGNQQADYSQLERVMGSQQKARGAIPAQQRHPTPGAQQQRGSGGRHRGRRRTVAGVRLFTTELPGAGGDGEGAGMATRGTHRGAQVEGQGLPVEDITALGSQPDPVALPSSLQDQGPHRPRHQQTGNRSTRRQGAWTDTQMRDAMAAVDGGMSMKKASTLHHIPYSTFREWCYGVRTTRKRGPPAVLSPSEEQQIVNYIIRMCEMGQGLTPTALKMKVYDICKSRPTPFRNGIPGGGWMRWWKRRHPELTLRVSQALETARAKGLCAENIKSFYDNLGSLFTLHSYTPDRIWNCDESGAQAGRSGGGVVIARKGARHVHSIVPDQREWLSVLVCINAGGSAIPSFYVFRGTRFRQNYIERCEPGATMAMQPRAWMTTYLFSAWLSHFIESVQIQGGISQERRHLLILDGHKSHCTLDVVQEARAAGLDILTLPAHTSHALQPLDVSVFKPFKQHFRAYRDFWTSRNMSEPATKSTLSQWVSLGLRKALTSENIRSGFRGTGIFPLNPAAMNSHLAPSEIFCEPSLADSDQLQFEQSMNGESEGDSDEEMGELNLPGDEAQQVAMEREFAEVPDSSAAHFFVAPDPAADDQVDSELANLELDAGAEPESLTRFLTLPTITPRANPRRRDPILDFTQSKILTSDEYAAAVQRLQDAKERAALEKERLREEKEQLKRRKAAAKEARAVEVAEARARRQQEKEDAAIARAARAAEVAEARATKAAEKARKAQELADQRGRGIDQRGRATEIDHGDQAEMEQEEGRAPGFEAQAPTQNFSFDAGGIPHSFFPYVPPSSGMQHPYFLPFNQFGSPVLSMSPTPQSQTNLQPQPMQSTPHHFRVSPIPAQGWASTSGGRGEEDTPALVGRRSR